MHIALRLFAGHRERAGCERLELDGLPEALDVAGLKRELERRHPELGSLASTKAVIGDAFVGDATALASGMLVCLLPPVSGGAPALGDSPGSGESGAADHALATGVFELCRETLDVERARARVSHPSCGAQCVFVGAARDNHAGRAVRGLEYEAYEELTAVEMARIFARCREHLGEERARGMRLLCQHRVGAVGINEPAVVVAVASAHRGEAFEACRFLIEELKRSMPIWKKELYLDGATWIGERS